MKTEIPANNTVEQKAVGRENLKLLTTEGPNEFHNVHCSLQDKAGNLWFGTTGEGVYRYDGNFFTQFTMRDGLSNNNIWSMFEDKSGNIWFGTADGLCRYDSSAARMPGGKAIKSIPIQASIGVNFYSTHSDGNSPARKNNIWSIMQDRKNQLWLATSNGVFSYKDSVFTRFLDNYDVINKGGLQLNKVEHILEDKAGDLWLGGRGNVGVCRYDGKILTNLKPNGENWAWPLLEDKQGNIWFSNWGGAYLYDGKSFTDFTKRNSLCHNNICRIIEDRHGNIWFGSDEANGGVCRYNAGQHHQGSGSADSVALNRSFTHFTTDDGLVNNAVWSILEDRDGNIWVGTRHTGLARYNPKAALRPGEKAFTRFSE